MFIIQHIYTWPLALPLSSGNFNYIHLLAIYLIYTQSFCAFSDSIASVLLVLKYMAKKHEESWTPNLILCEQTTRKTAQVFTSLDY